MTIIPTITIDGGVWVLGAFLILIYLVGGRVRALVLDFLDGKANHVRRQMDDAANACEEAEQILNKALALKAQSHFRTQEIINHAEEECERLRRGAALDLEAFIQTEERLLHDRMVHRERSALLEIEAKAIDIALKGAEGVLQTMITPENNRVYIEETRHSMATYPHITTTQH